MSHDSSLFTHLRFMFFFPFFFFSFSFLTQAFWDCSEKRLLGSTKAECSVTSEWSPDGRYFMTATTAPRLQIDNW